MNDFTVAATNVGTPKFKTECPKCRQWVCQCPKHIQPQMNQFPTDIQQFIKSEVERCVQIRLSELDLFVPTIDCSEVDGGFLIVVHSKGPDGIVRERKKFLRDGQDGKPADEPEPFSCEQLDNGSIVVTVPGFEPKVIPTGKKGEDGKDSKADIQCNEDDNGDLLLDITNKDGEVQKKTLKAGATGADSKANILCDDIAGGVSITIIDKDGESDQKQITNGTPGKDSQANIACEELDVGFELQITDKDGNTSEKIVRDGKKGEDGKDSKANLECEKTSNGIKLTVTDKDGNEDCKEVLNGENGVCLADITCVTNADGDYVLTIIDKQGNPSTKVVRNGRDGDTPDAPDISCQQLADGSVAISINGGEPKILLAGKNGDNGLPGEDGKSPTIQCIEGAGFLTFCINNPDGTKVLKTLTAPTSGPGNFNEVTAVGVNCDENGVLTVSVDQQTGGSKSASYPVLSKLLSAIEPPTYPEFCFSYASADTFQMVGDKVTIPFDLKVQNWLGGFTHVPYNPTAQCLEIPNTGPTKDQINQCIVDALAELPIGGDDGVSPEQAKVIAQACIDLLPTAPSYCNLGANVTNQNGLVTVSISQENCPDDLEFSFNVGDDGSVECCNESIEILQSGDSYSIVIKQTNGPDIVGDFTVTHPAPVPYCITGTTVEQIGQIVTVTQLQQNCPDPIQFSFTAGSSGGSVECCNTNMTAEVNEENKSIDFVIAQSVGANVTASVPIAALASAIFGTDLRTDTDGCSKFNMITLCGSDFLRVPVYQPDEPCCKRICVNKPYTGPQSIGPLPMDTIIKFDGLLQDVPLQAGDVYNGTLTNYIGPIDVCVADVCDNATFESLTTFAATPSHDCCDG